jgi:2-haloacid dehalogenase
MLSPAGRGQRDGGAAGAVGGGAAPPSAVVFDVGGVLIDWNPRHLYRRLFAHPAEMEDFLSRVCTPAWNLTLDAGRPFADGVAELLQAHPGLAPLIVAYDERWEEMVAGPIQPTVALVRRLKAAGVPLYAITNFSAEKFPLMRHRFDVIGLFDGIVVSGEEGMVKPDPGLYRVLFERYRLEPGRCLFIDDAPLNVAGAEAAGMPAIHFTDAAALARRLVAAGLPAAAIPAEGPAAEGPADGA